MIVSYYDGCMNNGIQYWKMMDTTFFEYLNHEVSKFEGEIGILERRHLKVSSTINLGKESNNLEEAEVLGVRKDDYAQYLSRDDRKRMEKELTKKYLV